MLRGQNRRTALAALATLALGVSACGGENGGGSNSSNSSAPPTADQAAAAQKKSDINAQPRDNVKDGGTIRWVLDQFSTQWNYNHYNGIQSSTYDVMVNDLMPSPFVADEDANVSANPNYVTKGEVTETEPKQVVTLDLNRDAKWSDGVPITEKDYETQWKALNGENTDYAAGSTTGYEQIESVEEGKDEYQVVITFSKPFGEWESLFAPLYPSKYQDTAKEFNTAYLNKIPVTGGPFKMQKLDKSAKTVTVVRDDNWWGNPAKLDSIVFRGLDADAGVGASANGEADYNLIPIDPGYFRRLSDAQGVALRLAGGPDFRHFHFNGESPNLSDVNVRRAVALGINRLAIVKSDLNGIDWPAILQDNHMFVNTQAGYQNNAGELADYDPEKAKSMLDAAGWKMDGQYRKKDGKELDLRFVIPADLASSRREGELTQNMLEQIGVKVIIDAVPSDDFFDKYILVGDYDLTPFSWLGTPFPVSPNKSIYKNPPPDTKNGTPANQQNFARVGSKEIDDLFNQAIQATDVEEARDLLNQADALVWDEVHSITLFQRPQITAVNDQLANIGSRGFADRKYEDIGFQK